MNKATSKQVDRYVSMSARDPNYAADSLAILHRCAPTKKTANEIAEVIQMTGLFRYLEFINGCYVSKAN